jgi:hypothetical protein
MPRRVRNVEYVPTTLGALVAGDKWCPMPGGPVAEVTATAMRDGVIDITTPEGGVDFAGQPDTGVYKIIEPPTG